MKTFLLIAAALLVGAPSIQAQERQAPAPMTTVSHDDLDLSRIEGRTALDRRLRAAARRVCDRDKGFSPLGWISRARCFRATIAEARASASFAAAEAERIRLANALAQ